MAKNFEDVDKFENAENFCNWPMALYLEMHSTF